MDNNNNNPWEENQWGTEQKVSDKGSFFKGLAAGIVITITFLLVVLVADTLLKKNYIETDDREQMMENADLGNNGGNRVQVSKETFEMVEKIEKIQKIIEKYFYYEENIGDYVDGIYAGMLMSLDDPYSVYYDEEAYQSLIESTSGTYCGIGVVVQQDIRTMIMTVVNPYEGCPAYEAGIRVGDIIVAADGVDITGMNIDEAVNCIRGEENTKVVITVLRDGEKMDFTVTRKKIEVPTVSYSVKEGNIAYIKVESFDDVTYEQFADAIEQAEQDGCKGYIFDVRDNGGGLYDTVVDMLDDLLPEGKIVYTEDKYGEGDTEYSDKECLGAPMAVLVNGNSASASEVFAGAIQDYGVGKLFGTTTYGKGIVQTIISLGDNTAIKLTISSYFTPNGRNIHGVGITPDVVIELPEEKEAYDEGGWVKEEYDTQLQEAIKYLKEQIQ